MPARDYEKQGQIGEGTFGTVSKAVHRPTGSVVAIKKIRCRTPKQGTEVPTLREIMLLQELQHENVIELIEVFVHNCNINLVFEFCSADLEHIVKTKTLPLDGPRIKGYMLGTLRGLAHCHSNWVLHRDLKPGNLLISPAGGVKIADFGLARVISNKEMMKTACGTPGYVAPEVLQNKGYDSGAVDMWSTGVILYILLCGFPPFYEEELPALFDQILKGRCVR